MKHKKHTRNTHARIFVKIFSILVENMYVVNPVKVSANPAHRLSDIRSAKNQMANVTLTTLFIMLPTEWDTADTRARNMIDAF